MKQTNYFSKLKRVEFEFDEYDIRDALRKWMGSKYPVTGFVPAWEFCDDENDRTFVKLTLTSETDTEIEQVTL